MENSTKIDPYGFREYDARWLYEKDINLLGIENLGKGLGTQVVKNTNKTNPRIIVGHDYRSYSEKIKLALKNLKFKAKMISKEGALEFWSSGGLLHSPQQNDKVREFDTYNMHPKHIKVIEINPSTAVAMYYVEGNVQHKGSENNPNYLTRVMQVYVKEQDGWKIRAAHWSPLIGGKGTTETAKTQ